MLSSQGAQKQFASKIIDWQRLHGRHGLPWQNTRDPYKVWLSEIMLQQTQVVTVIGYFDRFLDRFPTVATLASAPIDDVLGLWSGLGYYSRARNLHRCAQEIVTLHNGEFPRSAAQLQTLPGIGPSTAAAIASFCFSERVAILDGNVKRVLTRVFAFQSDISGSANHRALWSLASTLPPTRALTTTMPRYTQGLMDLGATVCTLRSPVCGVCPVQSLCLGFLEGEPEKYPVKTRKIKRTSQALWLLWLESEDGAVWLLKRPDQGIWGGLYCLPVFESETALGDYVPLAVRKKMSILPTFKHVLTHKDLHLSPAYAKLTDTELMSLDLSESNGSWISKTDYAALGLPMPIRKLLNQADL